MEQGKKPGEQGSARWHRRVMTRDEKLVRLGIQLHDEKREAVLNALRHAVVSGGYEEDDAEIAEALLSERAREWKRAREEEMAFETALQNALETIPAATPGGLRESPD